MDLLAAMRIYVRVVERGNMSRAARDLGIGQPAVSERIERLEQHLGVKLLRRSTRVVSCTDEGKLFYERCKQIVAATDEACAAVSHPDLAQLRGVIRIAAPQGLGETVLPRILLGIREQHPQLDIDLILNDRMVDPVTEGVDISLRLGQLGEGSFTARRLGHVRRVLVASPAYLERCGIPAHPDELIAHPFIRVMGLFGDGMLRLLDGQTPVSAPVSPAISVSHWRPVHELLIAGAGIGVLQEPVCADAIECGQLVRVLPHYTVPGFELNALCARPVPSRTRVIMSVLEKEIPASLDRLSAISM
nr:HTH-type transcriptional regulator DmlR [Paraburkholderia busanensis]